MSQSGETTNATELSEADKRKCIQDYCRQGWQDASIPVIADNLTFHLAVSYLALLRACEVFDRNMLGPVSSAAIEFAPGTKFGMELLSELEVAGLLAVSDSSDLDAFSFKDGQIDGYYPYYANRKVLVVNPMGLVSDISDLALSRKWPTGWASQAGQFWTRVALAEAKEYLTHTLNKRRVPNPDAARTHALLDDILRDHSVSQSYHFILEAGKETSDQMVRKRLRGQQAAYFMLESCQRNVDRARTEGRAIPNEQRIDDLPQSIVSFVLHHVFLRTGDKGFTSVPTCSIEGIR